MKITCPIDSAMRKPGCGGLAEPFTSEPNANAAGFRATNSKMMTGQPKVARGFV
jgi:hypothetical protein